MIIKLTDWQRSPFFCGSEVESKVSQILNSIRENGDTAIEEYATEIDGVLPRTIELKPFDDYELDNNLIDSIKTAAQRIEKFAQFQLENGPKTASFSDDKGEYGQKIIPIERVGAYIPGGRFPLISTALMTLIPAKIAGCKTRIACSPSRHPAILAAASLAGATKFVQIGGVQAIASLAYGFAKEPAVELIVGPGNAWVNEAKKQLQSVVKIDGLAGPSELLALCDRTTNIEYLALDALAQSEHDPMASAIIASDCSDWLKKIEGYLCDRKESKELLKSGQIQLVLAEETNLLSQFANDYAAEHLMLCHSEIKEESLFNYGSLFIGQNSAVALGDYISGPNHTLPTMANAKSSGGLSVNDFQKIVTLQNISNLGREALSNKAMAIADEEGLKYHSQSMNIRLSTTTQ